MEREQNLRLQPAHLELDVEKGALCVTLHHLVQAGYVRQLLARRLPHSDAADLRIVADHCPSAAGQPDVELKAVATVLQREIE